jgi:septal ring factor EnvC (AmiA/AmiB activator)
MKSLTTLAAAAALFIGFSAPAFAADVDAMNTPVMAQFRSQQDALMQRMDAFAKAQDDFQKLLLKQAADPKAVRLTQEQIEAQMDLFRKEHAAIGKQKDALTEQLRENVGTLIKQIEAGN